MTRHFCVRAYDGWRDYELTREEASALGETGLVRVEIRPAPGVYRVHGQRSVGVAAGAGWELRVDSHLTVSELMFLLTYARRRGGWLAAHAYFKHAPTLLAAIARGFVALTEDALRAGPLRGYRSLEETVPALRGRLRVGALVARGGLPTPVPITRDEYDLDVIENRLLLTAARRLSWLPLIDADVRGRLRRIAALLDGVSLLTPTRELPTPPVTRLNRHYEPALALAALVLRGTSLSSRAGSTRSVTFAFNLPEVFEEFLDVALGAALGRRGIALRRHPPRRSLDREGSIRMIPDFVASRGRECVGVLDAKFKSMSENPGDDAYQLLSYLLEFGPRFGALVTAAGVRSDHHVRSVDKFMAVRPLALDQPPEHVLAQIDALAAETAGLALRAP